MQGGWGAGEQQNVDSSLLITSSSLFTLSPLLPCTTRFNSNTGYWFGSPLLPCSPALRRFPLRAAQKRVPLFAERANLSAKPAFLIQRATEYLLHYSLKDYFIR